MRDQIVWRDYTMDGEAVSPVEINVLRLVFIGI